MYFRLIAHKSLIYHTESKIIVRVFLLNKIIIIKIIINVSGITVILAQRRYKQQGGWAF